MANDRLREVRDWINLLFTIVSVAVIPVCWLAIENQRLQIREEVRQTYVPLDVYRADVARRDAEIAKRDAEISSISVKIDRLTISVARLTDAVKLTNAP